MTELSEDVEVFLVGKYSRHYFCPGCSKYYLAKDCERESGPAICPNPDCNRRVRTKPLNKNRSKFKHKYAEAR